MSDTEENKKLNWMYKGPTSMVDREEYLMGRKVDKTLDQLNAEENSKNSSLPIPKNHVEHECIPPSIRDFNKIVAAEQVDISAKLQEDPLVAIKKREEEARRQFLQNPVQLKKLQKALEAEAAKKHKRKKKRSDSTSDESGSDLEDDIEQKLALLKNCNMPLSNLPRKSGKGKESALDTILMHKFNQLKDRLTEEDLREILADDSDDEKEKEKKHKKKKSKSKKESKKPKKKKKKAKDDDSSSEDSDSENEQKHRKKKKKKHKKRVSTSGSDSSSESSEEEKRKKIKHKKKHSHRDERNKSIERHEERKQKRNRSRSSSVEVKNRVSSSSSKKYDKNDNHDKRKARNRSRSRSSDKGDNDPRQQQFYVKKEYDSDGNEIPYKTQAWGLVKSDGSKIEVKPTTKPIKKETKKVEEPAKPVHKHKAKRLTEEEKEKLRQEMMQNAQWRDKERTENVKKYREKDEKEEENHRERYKKDFVHRELLKSANTATVEGRIKSNLNNIQRSSKHMESNFSRR